MKSHIHILFHHDLLFFSNEIINKLNTHGLSMEDRMKSQPNSTLVVHVKNSIRYVCPKLTENMMKPCYIKGKSCNRLVLYFSIGCCSKLVSTYYYLLKSNILKKEMSIY